jgi:hypothetical protein
MTERIHGITRASPKPQRQEFRLGESNVTHMSFRPKRRNLQLPVTYSFAVGGDPSTSLGMTERYVLLDSYS